VHREAERTAREKDVRYNGVPAGTDVVGPVLQQLRAFPPEQGAVWGAYAECNALVLTLATEAARRTAEGRWRAMGARSLSEAMAYFKCLYLRRWGCEAAFAAARMRVARMPYVGRSRAEVERGARAAAADEAAAFGATAFEADEAGYGVERMARGAPVTAAAAAV